METFVQRKFFYKNYFNTSDQKIQRTFVLRSFECKCLEESPKLSAYLSSNQSQPS